MSKPVRHDVYPEITWPEIIVGCLIGALITLSIGYLSLKLGFSIEGSELAAILGFGVLRGVMRRRSIIENNINQTIASSVNGASAGMMFSIAAGERYLNRVWSASTDGYIDEAHTYVDKARAEFENALAAFRAVQRTD